VPLVVELKGAPRSRRGLVASGRRLLKRYKGKVAIMSFDHWLDSAISPGTRPAFQAG